ncbi:SRPBCC domain-containing protein [Paenibacillus soyae]|uniref:SRPBCC family protein n=1 Tax=Paenibacillus soyae TaxID=2969249 RepID=A0A9X2SDY6_9BACL|nr:SRPBCC family protein [Paenibacillus soyae]MCR2807607.1 SRPBCC family protein [Paenibacillus soyae]
MGNSQYTAQKPVGKTAKSGFQIGVRRTLPISPEQAWAYLTSLEGTRLWMGTVTNLTWNEGDCFASAEGVSGELRVVKTLSQLRLKWEREDWAKPSTLQIRLLPGKPGHTTISFHQEHLEDENTREEMKVFWENVLREIKLHCDNKLSKELKADE